MTILKFESPKVPVPAAKRTWKKAANPLERAQAAADLSGLLDVDFTQVTRLKSQVANGDVSDPVVYAGAAELAMRKLVAKFGFDRLPLTWAEMNGFFDYCTAMHRFSGAGIPVSSLTLWRQCAREVEQEFHGWRVAAFDAYAAGDVVALLAIHARERTIERVAAEWREYDYEPGHPLFGIEDDEV